MKRAKSNEKETKRNIPHDKEWNDVSKLSKRIYSYRQHEYEQGLSDARKYVERRGFGEQNHW